MYGGCDPRFRTSGKAPTASERKYLCNRNNKVFEINAEKKSILGMLSGGSEKQRKQ